MIENSQPPRGWMIMSIDDRDKPALPAKAQRFVNLGFSIASTGGTARAIRAAGIDVTDLGDKIDMEELFGDLVKSLHHKVHGGILAPYSEEASAKLAKLGIDRIIGGYVTIYDGEGAIANQDSTRRQIAEKQDQGGPAMIGSFGKAAELNACDGHYGTFIATNPAMCDKILDRLESNTPFDDALVHEMLSEGYFTVARHRGAAAVHYGHGRYLALFGQEHFRLKYGENPQQRAWHYDFGTGNPFALKNYRELRDKEPGLINATDWAAMQKGAVRIGAMYDYHFGESPCIAIAAKHRNYCGAGVAKTPEEAIKKMIDGDRTSVFGGEILVSFPITLELADLLRTYGVEKGKRPLDVICAPAYEDGCYEILARQDGRTRILRNPALDGLGLDAFNTLTEMKEIIGVPGGVIVQEPAPLHRLDQLEIEKFGPEITCQQYRNLVMGVGICAVQTSNTILAIDSEQLIACAVAQKDRVGATELCRWLAIRNGKLTRPNMDPEKPLLGSTVISDSFFPETDGPDVLIAAGASFVFATDGSKKDAEVAKRFEDAGVSFLRAHNSEARMFAGHCS